MKSAKNWRPRWDFRFSRQRIWRWLSSRTCGIVEINRRFKGAYCLHHHHLDYGDSNNLWNVGKFLPDYNIPEDSYLRGRPQWREQRSQSGLEAVTSGTRGAVKVWLHTQNLYETCPLLERMLQSVVTSCGWRWSVGSNAELLLVQKPSSSPWHVTTRY
jgi:hypothetical protein